MNESQIFAEAIKRIHPAERIAYLDGACGNDSQLRQEVEALLKAAEQNDRFLEQPAAHMPVTVDHPPSRSVETPSDDDDATGTMIGGYKLLQKIGEGGMGTVWMAEQQEPVRRMVALKLVKTGMDSSNVIARFEAERQALALMDHPNIARIFDAGIVHRRPYFVMELVKGKPITKYCDENRLAPRERLELFVHVCQAIQHAHQKGIIHRDIKPSNVLVAPYDGRPVVKIIDFGVAKATGQRLTDKTLFTEFGAVVGTLEYMSPEQAELNNQDIDTRSDIYALGVLIYELLTGSTPLDRKAIKSQAMLEMLRLIREQEPPKPSTRLSTDQALPSISAQRQTDPAKLTKLMVGELDWIIMKSLEKDRTRRYETANGLAKDIQSFLAGETVEACPPTLGYRLKKAYRRNLVAVWVTIIFSLIITSSAVIAIGLAMVARQAEKLAESKRIEAEEQRQVAEDNKNAWLEMSDVYMKAAVRAEIRNAGARIDADLLEYKADSRVGLLRLARPLKDFVGPLPLNGPNMEGTFTEGFNHDFEFVKLREFQAAAVISAGQEFVPLVPPLEAAGRPQPSPDGRWFLSHTDRGEPGLWSMPSLKRVGLLREKDERVVQFGFTPDSKTVWTQDIDSIVRFWNTDGTLRAKTPLRPERYVYPAGMTHEESCGTVHYTNHSFVANGIAIVQAEQRHGIKPGETLGKDGPRGPIDLYDIQTGCVIRRLDWVPRRQVYMKYDWSHSPNQRWVYASSKDQVIILSSENGRELARLNHTGDNESELWVRVSPTGKWLLSIQTRNAKKLSYRLWNTATWQPVTDPVLVEWLTKNGANGFLTDDLLINEGVGEIGSEGTLDGHAFYISRPGPPIPYSRFGCTGVVRESPIGEHGGTLIRYQRILTDANTLTRLKPPTGRKYAPELARLAPDGRFYEKLDTVTEKEFPDFRGEPFYTQCSFVPGIGQVGIREYRDSDAPRVCDDAEIRILPDSKRLNIPPAMLELWAQVVTGGELTPDGRFEAWDEPTWTEKQKQLAAMKPPYPDFPFPGWAATEPNLWWRIRANLTQDMAERSKLLEEWHRRSGRVRPKAEPDTWRTPGVIPPPREKK